MNDKNESIDEAYSALFNSITLEPGLMGKTFIGKKLNDKFHNDNIDPYVYALKCLYKLDSDNKSEEGGKPEIVNSSIFYNNDDDYKVPVKIPRSYIRDLQLQNNLTDEEVITEIIKYLVKYNQKYQLIKKEGIN